MAEAAVDRDPEDDLDEARRAEVLDALGLSLARTRTEAIRNREGCMIENEWVEDEEFYEGIDDANRGEAARYRTKPLYQAEHPAQKHSGSTAFFNITRHYCDTGAARVGDMLLPTDDKGWAILPTPVPELEDIAKGKVPTHLQEQIQGEVMAGHPEMAGMEGEELPEDVQAEVEGATQQVVDQAAEIVEEAKRAAEKAEKRIQDWHVECQFAAHMRDVIDDCAQIGTGIIKGPTPTMRKAVAYKEGSLQIKEKVAPVSQRVKAWNCYPDWPACGENIHNGAYHWERDTITDKQLRDLKRQPGYLADRISQVLKEGPTRATKEVDPHNDHWNWYGLAPREGGHTYEIWYAYVTVKKEDLDACGCPDTPDGEEDEDIAIPAVVTMVNNHVIKAELNLLDTGEFPYDYMVWSKRSGMPWGKGIARLIRTPQRMLNSAARNMMNNAGIAGGPMVVMKRGLVTPADGVYQIAPLKIWFADEDDIIDDVEKAFTVIKIDMIQEELEAIILLAMKMAEDVTGMPAMLQGQQGSAPDTVGGMKILNDNAGSPMRRIARLFDDRITEPHVRRYYTYLLQYGPEDDEKGDFQIDARGSSALVERDLNNMAIREMGQIVADPTFGIDKKKWAKELIVSQRLDYNRFKFDDEQWEQLLNQLSEQAQGADSSVQVAQIRAEVEMMKAQGTLQDKAAERELKIALAAQQEERNQRDGIFAEAVEAMYAQLDLEKLESSERQKFAEIKADLAKLVMELREQRALARMNAKTTEIADPPTEPPGRADDGEAYYA